MTAVPIPRHPSQNGNVINRNNEIEATPVLVLKELVARLHREQYKVQNLLSSLGFALRSFNNLNQFLDLTPLMAAKVAEASGGALILWAQGQVRSYQLHCQEGVPCQDIRRALEQVTHKIRQESKDSSKARPGSIDEQVRQYLGSEVYLFSTPILVKNTERGHL